MSSLPDAVQLQGVTTQKKSTSILEFVSLTSPDSRYDSLFLSNYAVINLQNELARLPGVGNVSVFGAGQYAMRIWMNPELLKARGMTPQDVINVVQQQSQEVTAGQIGIPPGARGQDFQYTLNVNGRLNEAADYENIIVKVDDQNGGGSPASARHRPGRARCPDLQPVLHAERPAGPPASAFFSCRKPMRSPSPRTSRPKWPSSRRAFRRPCL
ncbi:efflux RND transporter permease subunit [Rhizobium sp. BG4]|uniref:efflux RND transporter permease subunit n=1 Tax=Rhizobium sp. BG4 TaxID=2613770 RepID=UPI002486C226|nr:efflux RND transporter permease subunit [Rhizobium sp. BG4]